MMDYNFRNQQQRNLSKLTQLQILQFFTARNEAKQYKYYVHTGSMKQEITWGINVCKK